MYSIVSSTRGKNWALATLLGLAGDRIDENGMLALFVVDDNPQCGPYDTAAIGC